MCLLIDGIPSSKQCSSSSVENIWEGKLVRFVQMTLSVLTSSANTVKGRGLTVV